MLICTICKQKLSKSKFWRRKNRPKGYSSACKNCCNKRRRERYTRDKDALLNRSKEWRANNQEHLKVYEKARDSTPERKQMFRENSRRCYQNNKGYYLMKAHKRRSMLRGTYTQKEWDELCCKHDNKCLSCGSGNKLTIDHVIPISKGGPNTIDNLQPLCLVCNLSKGTQSLDYRE